jgi:ankyrin repeat protein
MHPLPDHDVLLDEFDNCSSEQSIFRAIARGDVAEVGKLITTGVDLSMRSATSKTPLHLAIWCNQIAIVRLLLENGANPEALDIQGSRYDKPQDNSLRLSVRLGRRELVKILWGHRGNRDRAIDARDGISTVPPPILRVAARQGHTDVVTDLIQWTSKWTQEEKNMALKQPALNVILKRLKFSWQIGSMTRKASTN